MWPLRAALLAAGIAISSLIWVIDMSLIGATVSTQGCQAPLAGSLTCILRAKKVSFWAADVSSCDREYSLAPLKPSLGSDPEDEDACARRSSVSASSAQHMTQVALSHDTVRGDA